MNNSNNVQSDVNSDETYKRSRLDKAFPHIWLLSAAVISVVVLMVISGWKIVNLEQERHVVTMERVRIEKDRERLESDRQLHAAILKELPTIQGYIENLKVNKEKLFGKVQAEKTKLASLTTQAKSAQEMLDMAVAERSQAISDKEATRKVWAQLQNEIKEYRNTSEQIKNEVAQLNQQSVILHRKVKEYQAQERMLSANVTGLEKQKENLVKVIAKMSEDRGEFAKLSKRFNSIAEKIEITKQRADVNIDSLIDQTKALDEAIAAVSNQVGNLSTEVERVGTSSDSLTKSSEVLTSSSTKLETASNTVNKTNVQLGESIKRLENASTNVDTQAKRMAKTVEVPVNSVEKLVTTLSTHNTMLGTQIEQMTLYLTGLKEQLSVIDNRTRTLKKHSDEIQNTATHLDEINIQVSDIAESLSSERSTISGHSQELAKVISSARTQIDSKSSQISKDLTTIEELVTDLTKRLTQIGDNINILDRQVLKPVNPKESEKPLINRSN